MDFKLPAAKATGPLNPQAVTAARQVVAEEAAQPAVTPAPESVPEVKDQSSFQAARQFQLTQPGLTFADKASVLPPIFPKSTSSGAFHFEKNLNTKGDSLYNDFLNRRMPTADHLFGKDPQSKNLDYVFAKMSAEPNVLKMFQVGTDLARLRNSLQAFNPGAPRLSAADVTHFNETLKEFGFMTDGVNLYNLSVPSKLSDGRDSPIPVMCTSQEIQQILDFSIAAAGRHEGEAVTEKTLQDAMVRTVAGDQPLRGRMGTQMSPQSPIPTSAISGHTPVSGVGVRTPGLNPGLQIGITSPTPQPRLLGISSAMTSHATMMAIVESTQSTIGRYEQQVNGLISQMDVTDQQIDTELSHNETLQTAFQRESGVLHTVQVRCSNLLASPDLARTIGTNIAAVNADLAALNLQVERDPAGGLRFLQQGQAISEQDFRKALAQGTATQTAKVAGLQNQLVTSSSNLNNLQQRSSALSSQLTQVRQGLETHLAQAGATREKLLKHRQELQMLHDDPAAWAQLSPSEQQQVNQMLQETDQALTRLDTAAERGQTALQHANQQLTRSQERRKRVAEVLRHLPALLQNIKPMLEQAKKMLDRFHELLDKDRQAADAALALAEMANQLESRLSLIPGPELPELRQSGEDLLAQIENTAQLFQNLQGTQDNSKKIAFEHLEQVAQTLRENLNYQEGKLDALAEQAHDRIVQALKASLDALKALKPD